jgi:hypothetical protein
MTMARQNQMPYCVPLQQFDPTQWRMAVAPQQIQFQQPNLAEAVMDVLGKIVVAGIVGAAVYFGCEMLLGEERSVRHCGSLRVLIWPCRLL